MRSLDFSGFGQPMELGIEQVRREYEKAYNEVGIAAMVWDEDAERYRYTGIDKKWHWA